MSNIGARGIFGNNSRIVAEKTALTYGAVSIADQVIGSLFIPAGSLNVGECFRVLVTLGRDTNVDAYGANSALRMGVLGTIADTPVSNSNLSTAFPAASGSLSQGYDIWYRVVSIGANSVIERLGSATLNASFAGVLTTSAMAIQATLTGYNLTTQDGYLTLTTSMATAASTRPGTGYMRLEAGV